MTFLFLLETEQDRENFRKIYEENYLKMYHVVFGFLKQKEDAENAVHEAFAVLAENYQKYSRFSDKEMIKLCVTIAKNKAIDILRKKKRYSETELEEVILYDERTEVNPEAALNRAEEERKLFRALKEISEVFRETLLLKYYYAFSNREIAKIQGVSIKVVEMRLYRGKQKLKVILNEEENTKGRKS